VRDVSSYLLGAALVLKQSGLGFAPPPQVSLPVLLVGGLLVGVPGLAQLVMWGFRAAAPGSAGISGQPSGPAAEVSESLPPTP
jgi:hypothetical protein